MTPRTLRLSLRPLLGPRVPIALQRRALELIAAVMASTDGVSVERRVLGGVSCECYRPPEPKVREALLFFHGGGYCIGSVASHRGFAAQLARHCGAVVYSVDYRRAPEEPHPAALNDALAVYRALRAERSNGLVLAGDSAGGGLALACALALRDHGDTLPDGLVLLSPWVDLDCSGESQKTHAARDPVLTPAALRRWAALALQGRPADDPSSSPLFAELHDLPPTLLHVGSEEILIDDTRRLETALLAAGVRVQSRVWDGLWHDFHLQLGQMPAADEAAADIARFLGTLATQATTQHAPRPAPSRAPARV